jgi:signal transduction histidine kinase
VFQTPGLELDQRTTDFARTLLQGPVIVPTPHAEGLFVPLKIGTRISGLVVLPATHPGKQLTESQEKLLAGVADQVALAIKRAFLEDRAREADRLEREQAQSRAAKAEAIAVLAGGLAHTLNNLLTGVLGNVSLASDLLGERHPASTRLREAAAAADRAAAVVAQMLAYAGKGRFIDVDLDISQAAREFVKAIGDSIPENIHLEMHLEGDIPAIRADPNQIRQLIGNLYLNAVEAIGDKDGTVTIAAGVERIEEGSGELAGTLPPGDYIRFRVSDTGSGIEDQIRPRIFDPFFTTKFVGRGLGLAAADGIMRAHGGVIRVSGQPGGGSTFTCLFPVVTR